MLNHEATPLIWYWKEDKTGRFYIIGSDAKLYEYRYDSININKLSEFEIPNSIVKFQG